MSIMINPLNARLGVSRFWVTNFLPIVHSNYSLSMKRNYEDFVGTLEKFLVYFFNGPLRKTIFKLNIVYSSFKFNCFVFPQNNKKVLSYLKQYHDLELIFHDFTSDYKYTLSIIGGQAKRLFQPVLRKQYNLINDLRRKFIKNGVKYVKLLRIQRHMAVIFDVIHVYRNLQKDFRRILKRNMIFFQLCLRKLLFYVRITRLYRFFFSYNKLQLKIRFIPFSYRFSADFLSHFIIKKVKFGMPVFRVINMIYRFALKNKSICGFRLVCGGRFHRGQKAGYFIRSLGRFSFGFFESTKKGYVLDYSETRLQLKKGLVGIRIWLSQQMSMSDHIYPLRNQYIKPYRKQTRYKFKYRNYNVL